MVESPSILFVLEAEVTSRSLTPIKAEQGMIDILFVFPQAVIKPGPSGLSASLLLTRPLDQLPTRETSHGPDTRHRASGTTSP